MLEESIVLISSASKEEPEVNNIGTGFPFYREKIYTYLLTCAHVVKDVGGDGNVLVNNIPAEIVAIGDVKSFDLAVLRVEGLLHIPLLQLICLSEAKERSFQIAGNYLYGEENKRRLEIISGVLGKKDFLTQSNERVIAWELLITQSDCLKKGHSGAPIVDLKTGFVLGVATNKEREGKVGLAISVEALKKIWSEIPPTFDLQFQLNSLVFSAEEKDWKIFQKVYGNCCPEDWPYTDPQNIKEMINYLLDMPPRKNSYSSLIEFIARLLIEPEIKKSEYYQQLKNWGENNYTDLDKLLEKLKNVREEQQTSYLKSCLMIYVKPSCLEKDNRRYLVSAWFIPNREKYNYQNPENCYFLETKKDDFSRAEIINLLKDFWDESDKYVPQSHGEQKTIVELFLPRELLTQAVELWEIEPLEDLEPVGVDNQVVIRSSQRLEKNYLKNRYRNKWMNRWNYLSEKLHDFCHCCLTEECNDEALILKLTQTPCPETLKKIDQAAIPVAIWFRNNIEDVECINSIFAVKVKDLLEEVKQQRKTAFEEKQSQHIGNHISLFWEDPNSIPPNIYYSMP
ncbi:MULTISPECIES: trypsin-like peptidase domain-containing protein [Okeania]|nr:MULTISPECIES: trypsin-like peptidase domain-containing protein [Okeania]NET17722.1 trypsin-like peptidase domain-containing protein [Okeania sp. SIO1H6]NES78660.1 trypsin-like peptidase domain-containing protein [Okeania sp. SIO1H4]NET22150.1 trypsin-like peptidase domain-containing protein [Okeania sp. SIO1H5]NET79851.1 trypsin-like peptidase domain-containing protein [Okeania sp. SIO1F9]NET95508.1 trypsin-like peptidase domain-containing protein [Okeania sp. SIO1H2]